MVSEALLTPLGYKAPRAVWSLASACDLNSESEVLSYLGTTAHEGNKVKVFEIIISVDTWIGEKNADIQQYLFF